MFYYLRGRVAHTEASLAVIDCGGVGYAVYTSAETLASLSAGAEATLYTHCAIREDAFDIYGFASVRELSAFRQLIGVSGVGPKAALAILSACPSERLALAIISGDEKALTAAQGIGKKIAQRVILELKDKIAKEQTELYSSGADIPVSIGSAGGNAAEAGAALTVLGYTTGDIAAALRGVDTDSMTTEQIVRAALKNMLRQVK